MHDFICRLFFYVLAIGFLNTAFGSWPESPLTNPASERAIFYFAYYGARFVSWIALLEVGFQMIRYLTRRYRPENISTKELHVPDTNKLPKP